MEYTSLFLGISLLLSFLLNYTKSIPDETFMFGSDIEPEEDAPEEIDIAIQIAELRENECLVLIGDCWLLYKETKPHLPEERRLKICLKRITGFKVCDFLTDEHAEIGRVEAEERKRASDIEEEEKKMWAEERKRLLARRKEEMSAIWLEIKNGTGEVKKSENAPVEQFH